MSRWRRHPGLSRAVAVGTWLIPAVLSVATAVVITLVVSEPDNALGLVCWWTGIFVAAGVVFGVSWHQAKRAVPLSILLGMGIVFPGDAPSRLSVAARAVSLRSPARGAAEAKSITLSTDPLIAAERAVALAAAAGANDRTLRGHALRVSELVDLVACEMRLEDPDREKLKWAALLLAHPLEGEKLVAPLEDWLGEWASAIPEHHERYDGEGYPFGLVGDEISLGARIVAVVDAYDTMTNVRVNRRSLSPDGARAELARCAGAQFDPDVIRSFLAIPKRRLRREPMPVALLNTLPIGADGPELTAVGKTAAAVVVALAAFSLVAWKSWKSDEQGSGAGTAAVAVPAVTRSAATGS